jgi:hypothetical protein
MTIRSFILPGAFDPEAIMVLGEAFDAAVKELPDDAQPEIAQELIAGRIIGAARFGERDSARLLAAARGSIKRPLIGPVDRLNALGQLLYGEHWIAPMARDLQVCRDTMTNWTSGKRDLSPDHFIFAALDVLVHYHDRGLAKARRIMERNRI